MPGRSRNQVIAMRIAEHHPEKLHARNRGMLKMSQEQLHDYAVTPTRNLPKRLSDFNGRKKHKSKFSEVK